MSIVVCSLKLHSCFAWGCYFSFHFFCFLFFFLHGWLGESY